MMSSVMSLQPVLVHMRILTCENCWMGMFALESKPFTKMVLFSYTLFTWLNAAAFVTFQVLPMWRLIYRGRPYLRAQGLPKWQFGSQGVLSYMGYIGMCRCEGWFSSSLLWDRVYKSGSLGVKKGIIFQVGIVTQKYKKIKSAS